jgi:hypothetical protein
MIVPKLDDRKEEENAFFFFWQLQVDNHPAQKITITHRKFQR